MTWYVRTPANSEAVNGESSMLCYFAEIELDYFFDIQFAQITLGISRTAVETKASSQTLRVILASATGVTIPGL